MTATGDPRAPGRWKLEWSRECPPFAFRRSGGALFLVTTAAAPAGDDDLCLKVRARSGAHLKVRSAASTIAWAGDGSALSVDVQVENGACLDWHLQPLIVSSRSHFSQRSQVFLEPGASLRWVEEVVLGRHGEHPGRADLRLDATVGNVPLLRHELSVGPGCPGWDGPAVVGHNRFVGFVLQAGAVISDCNPTARSGGSWAAMPLEGPGVLVQAVASDLAELRCRLGASGVLSQPNQDSTSAA